MVWEGRYQNMQNWRSCFCEWERLPHCVQSTELEIIGPKSPTYRLRPLSMITVILIYSQPGSLPTSEHSDINSSRSHTWQAKHQRQNRCPGLASSSSCRCPLCEPQQHCFSPCLRVLISYSHCDLCEYRKK